VATAAAGVAIVRTGAFPFWVARIGLVIAVLCLPTIPPRTYVAAILLAAWTVVISVLLIASGDEVTNAARG
jgi:hypothetical protein